jgi:hypothetical protein
MREATQVASSAALSGSHQPPALPGVFTSADRFVGQNSLVWKNTGISPIQPISEKISQKHLCEFSSLPCVKVRQTFRFNPDDASPRHLGHT